MIRLLFETSLDTPIGELGLLADDTNLLEISFKGLRGLSVRGKSDKERFKLEIEQLDQYFSEKRKSFTINTHIEGTDFQELAEKTGHPKAYRAVGSTCGANRIPIVIPCHRVVSSSGLGGFGGGLKRKKFLLNLESN